MKSYLIAAVLVIAACDSDQEIRTITATETVPVTHTITNTVIVTVPAEDTDTTTTPTEELECGWVVPSNGAFGQDVYVESIPTFSLVDATTADPINHYQGEDAVFTFAAEASPCGNIELLNFFIVVQDVDGNSWLYSVYENGTAGLLTNIAGDFEITFNPVFARNMAVTPSGDELHYEWCHDDYGSAVCTGDFDQITLNRGSREEFEFKFTSTHLTPAGQDYEIFVAWAIWRDVTTGQVINDYTTYGSLNRPVHCNN